MRSRNSSQFNSQTDRCVQANVNELPGNRAYVQEALSVLCMVSEEVK